jgi:hypothetical protein
MRRTLLALLAPPAAVARHGCAACTAAPIGVFWLTSLAGIGYGVAGGKLGGLVGSGGLVIASILLWLIAAAWARLVMRAVESDRLERQDSTRARLVTPRADEIDPFSQLRGDH